MYPYRYQALGWRQSAHNLKDQTAVIIGYVLECNARRLTQAEKASQPIGVGYQPPLQQGTASSCLLPATARASASGDGRRSHAAAGRLARGGAELLLDQRGDLRCVQSMTSPTPCPAGPQPPRERVRSFLVSVGLGSLQSIVPVLKGGRRIRCACRNLRSASMTSGERH